MKKAPFLFIRLHFQMLKNPVSIKTIATLVNGEIIGESNTIVFSLSSIDEFESNSLTLSKEKIKSKLSAQLEKITSGAVLVYENAEIPDNLKIPLIKTKDPISALVKVVPLFFHTIPHQALISPKAEIHQTAILGNSVTIGAFSVILENAVIEDNVVIHPNVVIYSNVRIGANSIIHSGAVIRENCIIGAETIIQNGAIIGADGFGYVPTAAGLQAVPQIGKVVLKDKVEVGANSCIDRATLGTTLIGTDSKIDNLVQIGHNVKVGEHTIICGQTGIAGSTEIGNFCVLGGDVGVKDHVKISDKIRIGAKSGVISDLEIAGDYAGFPAVRANEFRRQIKAISDLGKKKIK